MDVQITHPKFQAFDGNGDPLSGGKVHTYEAGTSTPLTTYSDRGLSTPNANPVVLDSRGEASIYCDELIKIILKDSADQTIWTMDDMKPSVSTTLSDDDDDTKIQVEEAADEDKIRFDIGGTEQILLEDGVLSPTTDSDVDLGKTAKKFKDTFVDSVVLGERSAKPTIGAGEGGVYTKDKDGQPELYFGEESAGDEILITDKGFVALPRGYLVGFGISRDTDTDHDILIAGGACRDSGNAVNMIASAFTKQIDATWAAGDDAGGMFAGVSLAANTWYHVHLIRKDTDGSLDAGFDTSVSAANKPSGYTEYRRIGSIRTDAASNTTAFAQIGDHFMWANAPLDADVASPGTNAVTLALCTPSDVVCLALLNACVDGGANSIYLSPSSVDDEAPSTTAAPLAQIGNADDSQGFCTVLTNTSRQIRYRCSADTNIGISCIGWIDFRGRDD